ncbi:hypothetical protein Glove_134g86 [Diversispora epigaea]|uniref:Uncharacterized protein n=1 Tax=Diversispora epigaea TaxID=1348612 RepID=A0A397J689_9GLOM|nr:hypothetical protein Glove_134g86 [Diversispora epigaea]
MLVGATFMRIGKDNTSIRNTESNTLLIRHPNPSHPNIGYKTIYILVNIWSNMGIME